MKYSNPKINTKNSISDKIRIQKHLFQLPALKNSYLQQNQHSKILISVTNTKKIPFPMKLTLKNTHLQQN
jgi:hypothetical protein